ncbi:cystathionine beta-lyase [Pseudomonas sp. B6002]|uniref:cystathionine beta-lyase n=1 Tax=Pseudomonas sp. B6002 TaxID=2726978 RepID=UPI0015A343A4|nr:cystathionine beta-lyase [Pseudomonas sp. B6002]NVZ51303.1 cystathionine beta-lyase [Pseudomonas sp. B6002]
MPRHIQTTLLDPTPRAPGGFRSLATATHRGSTTLFGSAREVRDDWCPERVPYAYGLHGTPTSLELAARVAQLEGAEHCFITPGGQAAIALVYFAFCGAGDHVLVPQSAYGPNNDLARDLLARLGIAVQTYDPMIGAEIATLIRPNTTLIWCESPGSATMEIQDVPAIAEVARAAGVVLALDNTYASGVFFDAYAHGVDVSIQALTKYIGGHSDLLLGSVSTRSEVHYQALGQARSLLGMAVSPDDCSLALRGLQTLWVRLAHLQTSTLQVAQWLKTRPEVERVLHPAFPDCPGHALWLRDFTGSTSVFSVVFRPTLAGEALLDFIDRLNLFHLGYSWGGVTSLVAPHFNLNRDVRQYSDRLVRFNIGLEHVDDLIADLEHAFSQADNHGDGQ